MSFTDEEVEKLAQASIDQAKRGGMVEIYPERLQAFIARLEAAERLADWVMTCIKAWRKAKGEDGK